MEFVQFIQYTKIIFVNKKKVLKYPLCYVISNIKYNSHSKNIEKIITITA